MNKTLTLKLPAITPGPYRLTEQRNLEDNKTLFSLDGADRKLIILSEVWDINHNKKWRADHPEAVKDGEVTLATARANMTAARALPDLLEALLLAHDFLEDLRTSNPGYLAKLALQDYGRLNDLGKIPAALRKAGCTEADPLDFSNTEARIVAWKEDHEDRLPMGQD